MRIQYGCGLSAPVGWRNFDASPTLLVQKLPVLGDFLTRGRPRFPKNVEFGDVAKGLPLGDNSCEAVYCSHILEHLSLHDFRLALHETHRILAPGGVFRGVVPDLAFYINAYVSGSGADAATEFMRNTDLGEERRSVGVKGIAQAFLGNSRHRWMWDYASLEAELASAGFQEVRRAAPGDEFTEIFHDVEEPERWLDCLGFQGRKPCRVQ